MKGWLAFFLSIILLGSAQASDTTATRKKFFLTGFNAVSYKGSLSPSYTRWTPAYQIGMAFQKRRLLNGVVSLTFGQFIGESRDYKIPADAKPNLEPVKRFKTDFISVNYDLNILLFEYKSFRLSVSQGIGFFRFIPKDWDGNNLADRNRTRNPDETYNSISLAFPTQIGLRYSFANGMAFGLQAGWYNTVSNYLDNMSELANTNQGDNVATYRMQFLVPLH